MGIVSNKDDDIVQELSELHFNGLIKVAIGELPNRRMKPQPDAVFEAMRELGAQKSDTVYIGDSEVDVATALNAGLDCIAVDWGFRDKDVLVEAGADVILHTPGRAVRVSAGLIVPRCACGQKYAPRQQHGSAARSFFSCRVRNGNMPIYFTTQPNPYKVPPNSAELITASYYNSSRDPHFRPPIPRTERCGQAAVST